MCDTLYAHQTALNWIWYLKYKLRDDKIEILAHFAVLISEEAGHPSPTSGDFTIIDPDGPVVGVIINGTHYDVLNPKYLLDYPVK